MNEQRRQAVRRLSDLLRHETLLLSRHHYEQVRHLLSDKHAALAALQQSQESPDGPDTEEDAALARELAHLAGENRDALQRALRVQDRIMGIMADAAKRMMETPLYGGRGARAMRSTNLAVAMIKQA